MNAENMWNLSNPDTNEAEESVIVREVSSLNACKSGVGKVSCLERCPQFKGLE